MGEIPNVWNFHYNLSESFNFKARKIIFKLTKEKNLENFIKSILPFAIPLSLIENFKFLKNKSLKFPPKAKVYLNC